MAQTTLADHVQTRSPLFELPPRSQLGVPERKAELSATPSAPAAQASDRSKRREERDSARQARRRKRLEELETEEANSDPELQDSDAMEELAAAEEALEEAEWYEVLRSDADFSGTEDEWQRLPRGHKEQLVFDAILRRREALAKYRTAEAARALELAQAINQLSPSGVLQVLEHGQRSCNTWSRDVLRCGECRFPQTSLSISQGRWELRLTGLCEHCTPVGLAIRFVRHEMQYLSHCQHSSMTLAQRLEAHHPGTLSQPLRMYERITSHNEILCEHARPPKLTAEMMPHLHPSDPPVERIRCDMCAFTTCHLKCWAMGFSASCMRWKPRSQAELHAAGLGNGIRPCASKRCVPCRERSSTTRL